MSKQTSNQGCKGLSNPKVQPQSTKPKPGSRSSEGRGGKKLPPGTLEERKEAIASAPHYPHMGPKELVIPFS